MIKRILNISTLVIGISAALVITQCRVNDNNYLMNVNNKGVILDGYDTVAFFTVKKPVKGNAKIQAKYNDAIFYFSSEKNKKLFQKNPAKYVPQFGGWCAYAVSLGHVSPIGVDFFKIQNGRLILQHNQKAWDLYEKEPAKNLVKADKNWPKLIERHRNGSYVAF